MAIAYRTGSWAHGTYGEAKELSVPKPTGVEFGDIMLLQVYIEPATRVPSITGWTLLNRTEGAFSCAMFAKVYEGEAGPYKVTWAGATATDDVTYQIAAYQNAILPSIVSGHANASSVNSEATSITTTSANNLIVYMSAEQGAEAYTQPTGMTARGELNKSFCTADVAQAVAGASGAKTGTLAKAAATVAHLVALEPVPAATVVKPAAQTNSVGESVSLVVTGTHLHTLTAKELPAGLSLTKVSETEWVIEGKPATAKGATTVTLEGKNSESVGENKTFTWTINEAPPNLENPGTVQSEEESVISGFEIINLGGAVEAGGWSASGLPTGLSINTSTGIITGTVAAGTDGPHKVKIKAKNASGTSEIEFEWKVVHKPPKPEPTTKSGTRSVAITPFSVANTGGPVEAGGWSMTGAPAGITINSSTGEVTGTPSEGGSFPASVKAKNDGGERSTTVTFNISGESSGIGSHRRGVRGEFPLHLLINGEDYTFLLAEDFTFSNVDPGGYEMAAFTLPKDLPQILRGAPVRLHCGTAVAWEGRVKEVQRSLGGKTLLQCEGYGARLKDATLSMVFIDRDLTRWTGPSRAREIGFLEASLSPNGPSVSVDPTSLLPALMLPCQGPLKNSTPMAEAWYDAGPQNLIKTLYYDYEPGPGAQDGGVQWHDHSGIAVSNTSTPEGSDSGNYNGAAKVATFIEILNPHRYAYYRHFYGAEGGGQFSYNVYYKNVAVFGNHLLTPRGSGPPGLYTGDIVKWVIKEVENFEAGIIPDTSFYTVPHAVYYTPVEAQQILSDMAKLVGFHWGVWESLDYLRSSWMKPNTTEKEEKEGKQYRARVDFRPYPTSPTAYCWRNECEALDIREDLESQYNIAQVSYTDAAGTPQVSRVEVANPILQRAGIHEKTLPLSLGTSTDAAAKAYGKLALEVLLEQAHVMGTAQIKEPIHTITAGQMAPWMLKSGIDSLRVIDQPSADVWGEYNDLPVTRMECSGSTDGMTTSLEFGQGKNMLEVLTAELAQAALVAP